MLRYSYNMIAVTIVTTVKLFSSLICKTIVRTVYFKSYYGTMESKIRHF